MAIGNFRFLSMPPGSSTFTCVPAAASPLSASSTEIVASVTRLRPTHLLLVSAHWPMTIDDDSSTICRIGIPAASDVAAGSTVCCASLRLMALVAQSPAMTRTIIKTPLKANNFFFIFLLCREQVDRPHDVRNLLGE